jgi:hypothetical protein
MQRFDRDCCQRKNMKKELLYLIAFIAGIIFLSSCKKEKNNESSLFYGKWKTSYNDTIVFSSPGGRNLLTYNMSMNPLLPSTSSYEYTAPVDKLAKKDWRNAAGDFIFFQSFRWIQKGFVFEVQGVEWFPFMSSTLPYFTFTKIP